MVTPGSDGGPSAIERLDRLWRARRDGHPLTDPTAPDRSDAEHDERPDGTPAASPEQDAEVVLLDERRPLSDGES